MISLIKKTISGLSKTRDKLHSLVIELSGKTSINSEDIEKLEEALLNADIGWELTEELLNGLNSSIEKNITLEEHFKNNILKYLEGKGKENPLQKIILIVGVNGTGKTTSAAKLGGYCRKKGEKVMLVAADTYRAAAIDQIKIWSSRLNIHLVANEKSADPASVAYDGVSSGFANNYDRIIIDTSGRIHNSPNLMKELQKIFKVVNKLSNEIDVLMTLDANTGQNGIQQAREFCSYIPLSGIVLTKMDGTARGGIAIPIMKELDIPVCFMGIGENEDDLIPFNREDYITALISSEKESIDG
tara:strand:+ start:7176 stop:8078 length:903 start_codon:yes stop_codon:yes gene_type:complete